jgi:enterochelin esterase family protein
VETPAVNADGVTFRYLDEAGVVDAVSLVQEVAMPRAGPILAPAGEGLFEARFSRPAVDRLEYRFDVVYRDGGRELQLDPANPLRAPGAFGERSVIEFPGYRPPRWLDRDPPRGDVHALMLESALLGDQQEALLWASHGSSLDTPLPLMVVLDGLEFERFSRLTHMLDAEMASGRLPAMRALLLHPTRRDDHYSANPALPDAIENELLPQVHQLAPIPASRRYRVGLGASLGGLALLHAQRVRPATFGALFLESSSFFHHEQLLGFEYLQRIEQFVAGVLGCGTWPDPVPITLTCGRVELNLPNNRAVARALRAQGYDARLHITRDAHNWVAWRDAWTPRLTALLRKAFS